MEQSTEHRQFNHEKLKVYQLSLEFHQWLHVQLLGTTDIKGPIRDQLDRAAISITLNIAEGNGKFTPADRNRFFQIARASASECAACLDILRVRGLIDVAESARGKDFLTQLSAMLWALVKRQTNQVSEDAAIYETANCSDRDRDRDRDREDQSEG